MMTTNYRHLVNYSAAPPEHSKLFLCFDCEVSWVGCWDNFECPECGKGELPNNDIPELVDFSQLIKDK